MDLIIATIGLSICVAIWNYVLTRDKVFSISLALLGCSAVFPIFLHLRYDLGISWLIWFGIWGCLILYLKKKYPDKMKEWEKSFPTKLRG